MTTALSLFSGAEGFGLGARMAGLDVVASQGLQIGNAVPPLLAYALLRGVAQ